MAHHYSPCLLLLVLLVVISGISAVIETVYTSKEEDVLLPCFDPSVLDPKGCSRVRLVKYVAGQMKVILVRPETPKFQDAKRVKWQVDGNGQISLSLTKSQKSDEGLYGCEIWQGWDCVIVKNISLKVKDCSTLQTVKAVPSKPVHLNCPVDITSGQQGPQNISWAVLEAGNPVPVSSEWLHINGTSLSIQSVKYSDSGWYRCEFEPGQTQRCFDMKLLVQEENVFVATTVPELTTNEITWETRKEGSSRAFIAVVVASVITGITIMAALVGLFIHRRRTGNTQRDAQLTQRHTAVTHDAYEIVNPTPSDDGAYQQVNILYQQSLDDTLCTFQY